MLRIAIFEFVQIATSIYAWRYGGRPERIMAVTLLLAAWISLGVGVPANRYLGLDVTQFAIDLLLLCLLLAVAARANRFWPLWVAALHLVAIGFHIVQAVSPIPERLVYPALVGEMAYAICAALAWGTYHYRRRCQGDGVRPLDWSRLR